MAAFEDHPSIDYLRRWAQILGFNPCFDGKYGKIETMNENGANRQLCCVGSSRTCPCDYVKNGEDCEFEIFERVK